MEEIHETRRSSGIIDNWNPSLHNSGSQLSLRGHSASAAGTVHQGEEVVHTTPAGVPVTVHPVEQNPFVDPQSLTSAWDNTDDRFPSGPAPQLLQSATHLPFYKRRGFIMTQLILIPLGIILLFVLLFPVVKAIIQNIVNKTSLNIETAVISQATNGSFLLSMTGFVAHTGSIPATIIFTQPVIVSWFEPSGNHTRLGTLRLSPLHARNHRAVVNDTVEFTIDQPDAFSRFTAAMITAQNFTWRLESDDLHVQALKFPVAKGIHFSNDVTLNGFNNFDGNIILKYFQLPSDNPAGGINFIASTELKNPSPFALDLGTVVFSLSYQNVNLGMGSSSNTKIVTGTNDITLVGVLEPHTSASDSAVLSQLFTNYLNGHTSPVIARGVSTLQSDNSTISWLSDGLQALSLNVPFKAFTSIDPIRSISIGQLALRFLEDNPWSPVAESNSVQARLQLPFGFGLSIDEIQNDFNITENGRIVAGLSTPLGASTSSISVLNSTDTAGTINITIADAALNCPVPDRPNFASFNAELTNSDVTQFRLEGRSRAVAKTSIGQITLDAIRFNVTSSLKGLQGLKGMTTITDIDVTGGTADGITLAIGVNIFNPSNLRLETGDLTLQLFRDAALLGTALFPNLTLQMGNNSIRAVSTFEANNSPQGIQTLNDFVSHRDVQLTIAGFNGSTNIPSLAQAFETLSLDVILPALKQELISSASLTVLPTTGRQNNISHVSVNLVNPFSAPLEITQITSTVTSFGIPLGTIDSNVDFRSAPKTTTTSPNLDLNMNFQPATLFTVTRALAVEAGLDVAPLDIIVQMGGIQYLSITGDPPASPQKRQADLFRGFDLPTFVQSAFKKLQSDVKLGTAVRIGDYPTTLDFAGLRRIPRQTLPSNRSAAQISKQNTKMTLSTQNPRAS